jgi:hypothetical protein
VIVVALVTAIIGFAGGRATASHPKSLTADDVQGAVNVAVNHATARVSKQFANEVVSGFQAAAAEAEANAGAADLRASIPSVEAYFSDHGTYAGMTLDKLRSNYDSSIDANVEIVSAGAETYCVQATRGGQTWFKAGPSAQIAQGSCP